MAALGAVLQGLDGMPLALAKPARPLPECGVQIGTGAVMTGVCVGPSCSGITVSVVFAPSDLNNGS